MIATVRAALEADVPVLLTGAPGAGKTAALLALAAEADAHVEVLIGSTLDPVDVGGQPVPDATGAIRLSPPPWARRLSETLASGRPAWLFLDELSCAPASVQAALLRIVHERRAGEVDLSGCRIVAAQNPPESAADGGWLSPAMASRWCHVPWSVDSTAWVRGESSGWGESRAPRHARAAATVTAYLARHPDALAPSPPPEIDGGWPSPRSWSALARALAVLPDDPVEAATSTVGRALAAGLVGEAAAGEWAVWAEAQDLADPEVILADPAAPLPERGDQLAATLLAVAAAASADHEDRPRRVAAAWHVLSRVRPDQALLAGATLLESWPDVPDEAAELGRTVMRARTELV